MLAVGIDVSYPENSAKASIYMIAFFNHQEMVALMNLNFNSPISRDTLTRNLLDD